MEVFMRYLIFVFSFVMISCGKNSIAPNPALLPENNTLEAQERQEFTAKLSFVAVKSGVVQTGNLELSAMDLTDAQGTRAEKQNNDVMKTQSDEFVFYAKNLDQRLELTEHFSNAEFVKAEIIFDIRGELNAHWGWLDQRGAITWSQKVSKKDSEKLVLTLKDKNQIKEILMHFQLPALRLESKSLKMTDDGFASYKIHPLKLKESQEFDHSFKLNADNLTRVKIYSVQYQVRPYNLSLRYKNCIWYDNGDVGGRHSKNLRCREERCDVQMQQIIETKREELKDNTLLSFDQDVTTYNNWFFGYTGDSMRLNDAYQTEIASAGLVNQGTCAGKEMIDALPGTSQENIAPRKIVKLQTYLLL